MGSLRGPGGILSAFRGKVGPVVGSSWKGKPYIKSAPKKRVGKVGEGEQANRKRWAISQAWLKPILHFVRAGFKGYSPLSEGFVAAKSYLLKNAIEGEGMDVSINPALVKVSYGDLPLPGDITVELVDNKMLHFTWDTTQPVGGLKEDQVMLLAYDIENRNGYSYIVNGQFRSAGAHDLSLYYPEPGRTYHIYFAMVSPSRSRQSDSVYLGTVTIQNVG
jgi:hypothetical protein